MTEYAAHIRETDNKVQTVAEHLKETAELAKKYAQNLSIAKIAELAALIHDAGKFTGNFNGYIHGENSCRRGEIDHSFTGAKLLYEYACGTGDPYMIKTAAFIARVVISHHGLHDWITEDGRDYFSERISKNEGYAEASAEFERLFGDEMRQLLPEATAEYIAVWEAVRDMKKNTTDQIFYLGMFERLAESVLMDADRTNTADFMDNCHTEHECDTEQLWKKMKKKLDEKLEGFSHKTDRISRQRRNISDRCAAFADHKAGVCRLIVPTGGGKTLSSLRYAIEICQNSGYNMERIIYIAPFMSILEQNSDDIRGLCGDDEFLEHHSNMMSEIDDDDELAEYQLRTEKWDLPVIATTLVQFLNALYLGRTSAVRRMHRLSRAVIIIDEVQSVPVKCVELFNLAVNFLSKICGSTVVLCTATQPVFDRTNYPVIFDERRDITGDYSADFEIFRRTELIPAMKTGGYTYDEAAAFCYEKFRECGSLLVVVNTKSAAAELFRLMEQRDRDSSDETVMLHLSTNMCPKHRKNIIDKARKLLNRDNPDRKPVICVTTQLIEAGVDISFGCVVRSLAGMDNAAQAAGRCNRNGENEGVCPVYIIDIRDERLGNLNEIKNAQSVSRQIIGSGRYDDLLLPEPMEMYFKKYYNENSDKLEYKTPDKKDTLVDLLSKNEKRRTVSNRNKLKDCGQAFRTAGEIFKVLDDLTVGVIVPYDDTASELVVKSETDISSEELIKTLRKLQPYTVNMYEGMLRKLEDTGALRKLKCGALVLSKEFYDEQLGVVFEGAEPETIIL